MGVQFYMKYNVNIFTSCPVKGAGTSQGMVPQVTVMDMARARVRAIQSVMMATNHGGNSNVRGVVPLC